MHAGRVLCPLPAEPQPLSRKMTMASAWVDCGGTQLPWWILPVGVRVLVGQPGLPPGTLMVVALPDTQFFRAGSIAFSPLPTAGPGPCPTPVGYRPAWPGFLFIARADPRGGTP